ncbi:uncharacterized protein BO72DRAFT_262027 [Aspergillus fijiensis CBS 313.89]|uniref:Uncharacterized protein n=1 Tax=Aspergillus fijiensis CBS 313.89 TaxID=1448319 RepID=A0A8G1W1W5_9EURO|nr:uncharacterized protein BO72DRAFT_262027 [Aspergillus fijiensis CBS 313.89]RAK80852.1 hypothetical protein BO72DRAFT_262027 [Aspergillus fijiensis CBS 313.89]
MRIRFMAVVRCVCCIGLSCGGLWNGGVYSTIDLEVSMQVILATRTAEKLKKKKMRKNGIKKLILISQVTRSEAMAFGRIYPIADRRALGFYLDFRLLGIFFRSMEVL